MPKGIIVFGASGTGKTTLGRELAHRLGCVHVDIDDYIWRWDTEIPYTELVPREERIKNLMNAISVTQYFIMTGSMWSIRESFNPLFILAAFITVPAEIRLKRLQKRELDMFGSRILPGGDMREVSIRFLEESAQYDSGEPPIVCLKQHEQWTSELCCPVLRIDGTKPVVETATYIAEQFLLLKK